MRNATDIGQEPASSCNDFGGGRGSRTKRLSVVAAAPGDAYELAVQALRDVRHMLPPEGVAIVDTVLDGIGAVWLDRLGADSHWYQHAQSAAAALSEQTEPLSPEQENEFLEHCLVN